MQRKPEEQARKAIAPLSVLPIFLNLSGKKILMAGDGEGLAWKLELLASTGASIQFFATSLSTDVQHVVETTSSIHWHARICDESDFTEIELAIASFEDEQDASDFYQLSHRQCGVMTNIVDNPKFCDFQFGSIVNRSPVVVSISTSGAAPALGQVIRQRIETLLPSAIADWAKAAKSLRSMVKQRIPDADQRRDAWRRFAIAAFTKPVELARDFLLPSSPSPSDCSSKGLVTLVGAGPGDAELLTLKAVRALQAADIILFDDLVSDEVLDLARREAKRMLVGKRGGRASCKQEDINALMLKLARQGKNVVRLKSGDPMIFGRAGEELDYLGNAGIKTAIVPGITTALAAASQLGVSLTHRDCAQGVKFITAHSRKGILPDLDWRACADPATTLIVYMGGRTAPLLAQKLIEQGLSASTPVVIGEGISRPGGSARASDLNALIKGEIVSDQPVMIGIGQVFEHVESAKPSIPVLKAMA